MVKTHFNAWGGYKSTNQLNNILLFGAPSQEQSLFGIDVRPAHGENMGWGVLFETKENNVVTITCDLIGYAVGDDGQYVPNSYMVAYGNATYKFYFKISVSYDGGNNYYTIINELGREYLGGTNLGYREGWKDTHFWFTRDLHVPDFTHIKLEVYGENAVFVKENIYSKESIFQQNLYVRAGSIRKNKRFVSLNKNSGFLIRKSGKMVETTKTHINDIGKINMKRASIRKNGKWVVMKGMG